MVNIRNNLTLKGIRITTKVKAQELADILGVTVDTVYKWENAKSYPSAPHMVKILNFYASKGYIVDINDIIF